MFNMSGHKVEVCGLHAPTPEQERVKESEGIDVSDQAQVMELVQRSGYSRGAEEITMVVWGEDLARVPLLVYDDQGMRVGTADLSHVAEDPGVQEALIAMYDNAARIINAALALEQKATAPAIA